MSSAVKFHLPDVGLRTIQGEDDQAAAEEPKLLIDYIGSDGKHLVRSPGVAIDHIELVLILNQNSPVITEPVTARPEGASRSYLSESRE